FNVDPPMTAEDMNRWNDRFRWGQAAVNEDGNPRLRMEVNLDAGGVSQANFIDTLDMWERVLGDFLVHIDW
ncbi:MAG: YbjN domain-containing protein, partial [Okeania sp. SIO2D1]|nr:YbjN domain-containing protein [Okeania sp. SIO2D1]